MKAKVFQCQFVYMSLFILCSLFTIQKFWDSKQDPIIGVYPIAITNDIVMTAIESNTLVIDTYSIDDYRELPNPTGVGGVEYFRDLFSKVSSITGVEVKLLFKLAVIESSLNPLASARGTSAQGLFQFTRATWIDVVKKYGRDFGITVNTPRTDARANALMAGFHIRANLELMRQKTGKEVLQTADAYIPHLLGRSGALRFLNTSDNKPVAHVMPNAAKNNPYFFYREGKALTRNEVYAIIQRHIQYKVREFGIEV